MHDMHYIEIPAIISAYIIDIRPIGSISHLMCIHLTGPNCTLFHEIAPLLY